MPEMQSRRNDKVVLRSATTTRKAMTVDKETRGRGKWERRGMRGWSSMGRSWVCFEFNSPRRGINSLEGKPFGARSVTRLGWNVLGVFITLMERECRRWYPGRGGWKRREGRGGERRKRRLRRMLWNRQERIITLAAKRWKWWREVGSGNSRTERHSVTASSCCFSEKVLERLNPSPCTYPVTRVAIM